MNAQAGNVLSRVSADIATCAPVFRRTLMARCNTALSAVQQPSPGLSTGLSGPGGSRTRRRRDSADHQPQRTDADRGGHRLAILDGAGEDRLGQRILHRFLDDALERTRPIGRVIALLAEPVARLLGQFEPDLALVEELFAGA